MYGIKKTQERFMELLGTPTGKVTTASGTVFYLNAISKAIAMVSKILVYSKKDYNMKLLAYSGCRILRIHLLDSQCKNTLRMDKAKYCKYTMEVRCSTAFQMVLHHRVPALIVPSILSTNYSSNQQASTSYPKSLSRQESRRHPQENPWSQPSLLSATKFQRLRFVPSPVTSYQSLILACHRGDLRLIGK